MAFRADEAAENGFDRMVRYLTPRDATPAQRETSLTVMQDLVDELGPVIDYYPSWHPLVAHQKAPYIVTTPSRECGYEGLDHTICFVNGFITCPYNDGQDVIDSVNRLPRHPVATITARRLGATLYRNSTNPILVRCEWHKMIDHGHTIPTAIALPLLLRQELSHWESAELAETWNTMIPYFLGKPHGKRSSLFVTQETGMAIKKIWESLINTGMFGPIKV